MLRTKNPCQTSYVKIINKYKKIIPENTLHCVSYSEAIDIYQVYVVNYLHTLNQSIYARMLWFFVIFLSPQW